ncbi:MAG: VOC family protein [Gemmatimonadota bacterium]|nr:VOC family protein [Gemmatimonadota bacterium]
MPQENSVSLSVIGQISVTVQDLDRAVAFYRDKLGMRFLFRVPGMAFFNCSGVRLLLGLSEDETADVHASVIYYKVDDLEGTCEELHSRGVDFESKPHKIADMPDHELWMAFFTDSEKNLMALMAEKPREKQ